MVVSIKIVVQYVLKIIILKKYKISDKVVKATGIHKKKNG